MILVRVKMGELNANGGQLPAHCMKDVMLTISILCEAHSNTNMPQNTPINPLDHKHHCSI